MRPLARIAGVSDGEVSERRAGIHEVEADAYRGRVFDEGVVKPGAGGVDFQGSVADVGRLGIRSTGAGDGQVGEIGGFVVGVIRVVVLVHVDTSVHGVADVGVAHHGVGVATVVDVANDDTRIGG